MWIKMAVAFANIFVARRENQILRQMNRTLRTRGFFSRAEGCFSVSAMRPTVEKANNFHSTFTADVSDTRSISWTHKCTRGWESIVDVPTHYTNQQKPFSTPTFTRVTHQVWQKGSIKGDALRFEGLIPLKPLLRKMSKTSKITWWKEATPPLLSETTSLSLRYSRRQENSTSNRETNPHVKKLLPPLLSYNTTRVEGILNRKWHLIQNQQRLGEIFKKDFSYHIARDNPC